MNEQEVLEVLQRVQQDINWMMNNQQLLNPFVFDYLHEAVERLSGDQ